MRRLVPVKFKDISPLNLPLYQKSMSPDALCASEFHPAVWRTLSRPGPFVEIKLPEDPPYPFSEPIVCFSSRRTD